jgi:hypothetical protein
VSERYCAAWACGSLFAGLLLAPLILNALEHDAHGLPKNQYHASALAP